MTDQNKLKDFSLELLNSKGVGSNTFIKLLNLFGSIEMLFNFDSLDLEKLEISEKLLMILKNVKEKVLQNDSLQTEFANMKFFWEDDYPQLLKEIYDPPAILYFEGDLNACNNEYIIGIVGTRKATNYGRKIAKEFTKDLVRNDFVVVSGLADGIDTEVHKTCLEGNGKTIAVLGTPVDMLKRGKNRRIAEEIINKGGLILSEYPKGMVVMPGMFAKRNRIIAGLSKSVLIVEAPEKSGALITAGLANEYDRDVFAIPGNLDSENSKGCNSLIKNSKAQLAQDSKDILDFYGIKVLNEEDNNLVSTLSKTEKEIYNIIKTGEKIIDEILNFLKIDRNVILYNLTNLELKGIVDKDVLTGRYYIK